MSGSGPNAGGHPDTARYRGPTAEDAPKRASRPRSTHEVTRTRPRSLGSSRTPSDSRRRGAFVVLVSSASTSCCRRSSRTRTRARGSATRTGRGCWSRSGLRSSCSPPTWRCFAASSATRCGFAGRTPTTSRWRAWRRRGCSRPAAPAASCSPTGRCARRGCRARRRRRGWSRSWSSSTPSTWSPWSSTASCSRPASSSAQRRRA